MTTRRFIFLDVLRGIAVLWMIQTHITNVVLAYSEKANIWFHLLNISNGYVAPTFIFCAGAGMWIALSRKGDAYLRMGPELRVYLRRLLYILFLAYMMHVPVYSLSWILRATSNDLVPWLMIDVLQTIVYSTLAVLCIFLAVRKLSTTVWIVGALAVTVAIASPYVWASKPFSYLPPQLAIAITNDISPFPLLPWVAYFFAGFFIAFLFFNAKDQRKLAFWFVAAGFALPILLFVVKRAMHPSWTSEWWDASPQLVLFRIAGILLFWGFLYLFEEDMKRSRGALLLQAMGTESLFLYLSHTMIVYGALSHIVTAVTGTPTLGYAGLIVTFVLITAPLVLVMLRWSKLKSERPVLARRLLTVQVAWMLISFAVTPAEFALKELFSK